MIPDFLYQVPSVKDWQGGMIQFVCRQSSTTVSAAAVDIDLYEVPQDKVLAVQVLKARGNPGAGQICSSVGLRILGAEFVAIHSAPEVENATADLRVHANFTGPLWVPPGSVVSAAAAFDSAVAANQLTFSVVGILIPRGNLQFG